MSWQRLSLTMQWEETPAVCQVTAVNIDTCFWWQCADCTSSWKFIAKFSAKSNCRTTTSSFTLWAHSNAAFCCLLTRTCLKNVGIWALRLPAYCCKLLSCDVLVIRPSVTPHWWNDTMDCSISVGIQRVISDNLSLQALHSPNIHFSDWGSQTHIPTNSLELRGNLSGNFEWRPFKRRLTFSCFWQRQTFLGVLDAYNTWLGLNSANFDFPISTSGFSSLKSR